MKKILHSLIVAGIAFFAHSTVRAICFDIGTDNCELRYTHITPELAMDIVKSYMVLWTDLSKNPELVSDALQKFEETIAAIDAKNVEWHLDYASIIIDNVRTDYSSIEDQQEQYSKGRVGFAKMLKFIPMLAMMEAQLEESEDGECA